MDQFKDAMDLLDLMAQPAFCVRDGIIIKTNTAGAAYGIEPDTNVTTILETGAEEYSEFSEGCLYLNININGESLGVSVFRIAGCDIFRVEQDADNRELQVMALASRELRKSLNSVMTTAQTLFPLSADGDPETAGQVARLNRGLFQMLRVIENMSDANRYCTASADRQEMQDLCSVFQEAFDKAAALTVHAGLTLEFENLPEAVYGLADVEKLERAVFNIISNAVKFSAPGGCIHAKLARRGRKLYLTVEDSGSGIAEHLRSSIFSRYTRLPGLEDGRFGIGLGMVLVRSAAALHGGTVLVDTAENGGTRILMSLAIRTGTGLRSPIRTVDYAGGWDTALIALAESLPAELYLPSKNE